MAGWQHTGMIPKQQYVEYLISTVANYTGSHLAEYLVVRVGAAHYNTVEEVERLVEAVGKLSGD